MKAREAIRTKRIPHYLKANKSLQQPNNIIWFDTETKFRLGSDGKQYHYLWFGWACYQRRDEGKKWSEPEWLRFTSIATFWDWVISKTRKKTRLYLMSHNGGFDLPVMHAFTELPENGYKLKNAVADAPPLILTWKKESRTIKFVDSLNIWRLPLKAVGESIGIGKMDMPLKSASIDEWDLYGKRDTEIIRVVMLKWLEFLKDNDLGGFAPTLASQAFNAYRHRFMPIKILIHNRELALDNERNSYVGGRTECFKIGTFKGEFYYIDVNSQYPSVMYEQEYPYQLLGTYDNVTFKELGEWLKTKAVIGCVTINTSESALPFVMNGKLIFPVGVFSCTLAGPELSYALTNGLIESIGLCSVYLKGPLFQGFVAYMYNQRLKAKAEGNITNTWLYKIMMSSLYGKFGQRGRRYEIVSECDPNDVKVWIHHDADTGETVNMRRFGGIEQEWIDEGESRESFCAIASYVSSFARMKMWDMIKRVGRENCYYCDTDSLVINRSGYDRVHDLIDDNKLGMWGLDRKLKTITIHGPKDYVFDDDKKVKGIRKKAVWNTENVATQDYFVGLKGLIASNQLDNPIVFPITKVNSRIYTKGTIQDDGTVLPLCINC
ncbi:hypothetical protein LCGC14_0949180 [marine sediment metagenome]|uniref:DNA-directed DNA polymerase n=1 Tax=marine sediment metagenome TaxID=412755 RepID=A0A0F9NHU9_9ZZZZ